MLMASVGCELIFFCFFSISFFNIKSCHFFCHTTPADGKNVYLVHVKNEKQLLENYCCYYVCSTLYFTFEHSRYSSQCVHILLSVLNNIFNLFFVVVTVLKQPKIENTSINYVLVCFARALNFERIRSKGHNSVLKL
jgi:hypothetical protein